MLKFFLNKVLYMRKLAIFDLDHTLIACDSDQAWVAYLHQQHLLDDIFVEKHNGCYQRYADGTIATADFVRAQLKVLAQIPKSILDQHLVVFLEQVIAPKIYPESRLLIQHHQNNADDVVLISATNHYLVAPIAQLLGIRDSIGIVAEQDDNGNFTGHYVGTPSFRDGKIICLQNWLLQKNRSLGDYEESHFYSDSINDLPLLQMVSHPHVVNGDSKLSDIALANGWQMSEFLKSGDGN